MLTTWNGLQQNLNKKFKYWSKLEIELDSKEFENLTSFKA
jgi:hypothetical protein